MAFVQHKNNYLSSLPLILGDFKVTRCVLVDIIKSSSVLQPRLLQTRNCVLSLERKYQQFDRTKNCVVVLSTLKNIKYLLRNEKRFQKFISFVRGQILRACAYYNIARLSTTWKLHVSDQTAGHGLKWTKCPAVRNIHQIATERFLQTS